MTAYCYNYLFVQLFSFKFVEMQLYHAIILLPVSRHSHRNIRGTKAFQLAKSTFLYHWVSQMHNFYRAVEIPLSPEMENRAFLYKQIKVDQRIPFTNPSSISVVTPNSPTLRYLFKISFRKLRLITLSWRIRDHHFICIWLAYICTSRKCVSTLNGCYFASWNFRGWIITYYKTMQLSKQI